MEEPNPKGETELVRCLDCGTVYALPVAQDEAAPCPNCGGVAWVAVDPGPAQDDS